TVDEPQATVTTPLYATWPTSCSEGCGGAGRTTSPGTTKPLGRPFHRQSTRLPLDKPPAWRVYLATWEGWAYLATGIDLASRRVVGWPMADHMEASLFCEVLKMAIWARREEEFPGLVHHSDRSVQYLSIRYTERLAEIGAAASVGSRGDSYD